MTLAAAPYFEEIAGGPPAAAHWVTTSDDLRIRVAAWQAGSDARGTVLLFPGRTEYVEKYGVTAGELAARGFATIAVDWRGQGLADRLLPDVRRGHVERFSDYLADVEAMLSATRALDLPRPWHLLAHSMGGGIGLRALMDGLEVQSCAFTGPMWGISMSPVLRPVGWTLALTAPRLGLGHRLPPTTSIENYVLSQPFEGNQLTRDPEMYAMMRSQLETHPELALGGPTLTWLRESLLETRRLAGRPSPDLPCLCVLGAEEKIVDTARVHARMRAWPGGALDVVPGAEHEVLMERPSVREQVLDKLAALFSGTPAPDMARAG